MVVAVVIGARTVSTHPQGHPGPGSPPTTLVMELETGGGDAGGCGGGEDLRSDGGAPASVHEQ